MPIVNNFYVDTWKHILDVRLKTQSLSEILKGWISSYDGYSIFTIIKQMLSTHYPQHLEKFEIYVLLK